MADIQSILDYQKLQRLPVPTAQPDQMPSTNPLAAVPVPAPPAATLDPAIQNTQTRLLGDQNELNRVSSTGSGISQIKNPILRGLARFGEGAESLLLPGAAAFTPGTELNHQRILHQDQGLVNSDLGNQQQQAGIGQTEANTNYLNQRPQIEQSKIDQKQTAVQERVAQAAAAKGQLVSWDANGLPTFTDDHNSQAFADHQALSAMHQATADKSAIMADIQKNHYIPGTPEWTEAQKKLSQVDARLNVAMGSLGLRAQGLQLRKENQQANLYGTDLSGTALPGAAQITGDDGTPTTVGAKFANTAVKQQKSVGSFNDLSGSITHTRNALNQFFQEGGSLADPRIVAAMSDPNSTVGKVINGQLIQGGLSPSAITAINSVRQLHEQAGILRSTTGGTASEAGAQRILDVVPSAGDANAMALQKLEEQENVLRRLSPGQTRVTGGLSVKNSGQISNAPSAPSVHVGQQIKLKNGSTITVKVVHPDGSFE